MSSDEDDIAFAQWGNGGLTTEFVAFDGSGREVDWIDPVFEFTETDDEWIVHNGAHEYRVSRAPGLRCELRKRKDEDDEQ